MAKNPLIPGYAPGYWGGNPHQRINSEHVIAKVTSWNYDKIMAMGMPYAVWREASSIDPSLPQCSCVKDTAKQADVPCLSCYGTGKIPGYFKFGTQTYWASSFDATWALTDVVLDKTNRPFRLRLADAATTGTAITNPISISVLNKKGPWEYKVDGFTRDGGSNSSIVVEYSIDGGITWLAMSQLNTSVPTTTIKFKVTLTRSNVSVKSPVFEIVRIRFQTMLDLRGEANEPVIRIISTWDKNSENRTNYGERVDSAGKRFWTLPLTFFDSTMPRESGLARLSDDVMVEVRYGANLGTRYAVVEFNYSDTFGEFTRQEFGLRQYSGESGKTSGEFAYRVF